MKLGCRDSAFAHRFGLLVAVMLLLPAMLWAGKGTVEGKVTDVKGNPLPGVNVLVKGTYYGAATDENGYFRIGGMSPGFYDLQFSMIGYKVVLKTGIKVTALKPTYVEVQLQQTTLAFGQEIVVEGERPLLEVDQTASSVRFDSKDLDVQAVHNVKDVISNQVGVSTQDDEVHIRGGRVDESMFIVDGLSVKDPLSGYSNNLYVNVDAIQELEVITGGFNAEYGQAMSGIVNIKLKEGSDHFQGSFTYASDYFGLRKTPWFNEQTDRTEFILSGPEPFSLLLGRMGIRLPGKLSFFSNGYMHLSNTYLPHAKRLVPAREWMKPLARREENDWHFLYKTTWKITPQQKLSFSYDHSLNINQGYFMSRFQSRRFYPYDYQEILDQYNTLTKESILTNLSWTQTLSSRAYYELILGRFFTNLHSAAEGKLWSAYDPYGDTKPIHYYLTDLEGHVRVTFGDRFWDQGNPPDWYDYYSDNWSFKGTFSYHPSQRHQWKTGFEHQRSELQVIDIDSPWLGSSGLGRNYDAYRAVAYNGAFYIQDKITFSGMIANLGLRYDYWFPGKYLENAVADTTVVTITPAAREKFYRETFELFGYRGKGHLSPRLGISHPVTDSDVLYFNYGHFSQLPTYNYVYAKLHANAEATYQLFGNPNLNPKTTVAYEIGIKHKFDANQVLEIKAFYKDMFDYETSQRVNLFNPRLGHMSFLIYINMDYARSRGLEMRFRRRFARYFSADANFTYSISTGKSSTPLDNLLVVAGRLEEKPLGESYLRWDQPLRFYLNLNYRVGPGQHPRLGVWRLPSDWSVNLRFDYHSGRRYTPMTDIRLREENGKLYYEGTPRNDEPYSALAPPVHTLDLKAYKVFHTGKVRLKAFLQVENLLNSKLPRYINPFTGRPYDPGEIYSYSYVDRPNPNENPARYLEPRNYEFGLTVYF